MNAEIIAEIACWLVAGWTWGWMLGYALDKLGE